MEVNNFLFQGKGKSRLRRNNVVYARKRNVGWIFPEVPEGWNPRGETREITPPQPEPAKVIIDGFEITNEVDEDVEPLFVTRDDPLVSVWILDQSWKIIVI